MSNKTNIRLINGDCIEEMQKLIEEEVKVDLVLTDPPYGTTNNNWDIQLDFMEIWDKLNKLSSSITTTLIFGSEPFSTKIRSSNLRDYKYDLYWIKNRSTGFAQSKNKPLKNIENIMVFSKGTTIHKGQSLNRMTYNPQGLKKIDKEVTASASKFGNLYGARESQKRRYMQEYTNYPKMTLEFKVIDSKKCLHPTQKPLHLLEYLIRTYSNPNDIVLDFTMGSGSTGVACQNLNRDFIGIELEEKYYRIAEERLKENTNQTKLI